MHRCTTVKTSVMILIPLKKDIYLSFVKIGETPPLPEICIAVKMNNWVKNDAKKGQNQGNGQTPTPQGSYKGYSTLLEEV